MKWATWLWLFLPSLGWGLPGGISTASQKHRSGSAFVHFAPAPFPCPDPRRGLGGGGGGVKGQWKYTPLSSPHVSAKLEAGRGGQWLSERRLSLEWHGADISSLTGPGLRVSLDDQMRLVLRTGNDGKDIASFKYVKGWRRVVWSGRSECSGWRKKTKQLSVWTLLASGCLMGWFLTGA